MGKRAVWAAAGGDIQGISQISRCVSVMGVGSVSAREGPCKYGKGGNENEPSGGGLD